MVYILCVWQFLFFFILIQATVTFPRGSMKCFWFKSLQTPIPSSLAHGLTSNQISQTVNTFLWHPADKHEGNITPLGELKTTKKHSLIWRHWSLTGIWQQFQSGCRCCLLSRQDSQQSPVGRLPSGKWIHQTLHHHFWEEKNITFMSVLFSFTWQK